MQWVEKVLERKGLHIEVINRIKRYYQYGVTIPLINNTPRETIKNSQKTLRQGDCPSTIWFNYGIDPLILYLHRCLQGIQICNIPVSGPTQKQAPRRLPVKEPKYTVIGFCDDIKPAITSSEEFEIVNQGTLLYEKASGCRLHRDTKTD